MAAPGQVRMESKGAQYLGLLTPHHIRRAGFADAGKTGQDGDSASARVKTKGRARNLFGPGRTAQIGHFLPADGGSHHAAQDGGQYPMRPVPDSDGGGETAG